MLNEGDSPAENGVVTYYSKANVATLAETISPEEQQLLHLINQKIAAKPSIDQVIDFLFTETRSIFPCDRIGLAILDGNGQLVSRCIRTDYQEVVLDADYGEVLNGSSLEQVISGGTVRIISDLAQYQRENPGSRSAPSLLKEGVRSSMTCPLFVDGRVVGVLFRSSKTVDAYTVKHAVMHQQIAERLGQAVEKTYQIEKLEQANRGYIEMLSFVSHELKNPLATLIMDGELLLDGYVGNLSEKQTESVERMVKKGRNLVGFINEYMELARFEGGQMQLKIVAQLDLLQDILQPVLEQLEGDLTKKGVEVKLSFDHEPFYLTGDQMFLRLVFANLIENGVKYGQEGGEITISAMKENGNVQIRVRNAGVGFPEEDLPKLFKKFSRLQLPAFDGIKGTGVGLYLVWQIVQRHRGTIVARSKYGEWAEFEMMLPDGNAKD